MQGLCADCEMYLDLTNDYKTVTTNNRNSIFAFVFGEKGQYLGSNTHNNTGSGYPIIWGKMPMPWVFGGRSRPG